MAFRFRKSFKIAPGVRVNIGKKGLSSVGIGPRGASMSIGSQGKHANIGIPGTGLSFRHKIDGTTRSLSDSPSLNTNFAIIDINKKQFNRYKNFYGKSLYQLEQETSLSPATQYR